jgi:dienelactone hydrolase
MTYNPLARGPHPVGVRTIELSDAALSPRPIPTEIWYPATTAYLRKDLDAANWDRYTVAPGLPAMTQQAIRDADAATGPFPLFMYFHGGYGQRREASHICTHLASHGYVAASANFPGDNVVDLISVDGAEATVAKTPIDASARRRPSQASRFIDLILNASLPGLRIDASRIGAGGISMGGFTSLAVNSLDDRLGAVVPMCPMFGERSMSLQVRRLGKLLRVDNWRRQVPTLLLTGEVDPLVNVQDIRLLYSTIAAPKRLVVLRNASHLHFADNAEAVHEWYRHGCLSGAFADPELDGVALGTALRPFAELCTEAQSGGTARGLCLAHMDAHLKGNADAMAFLDGDLAQVFAAALGVELDIVGENTPARV